MALHPDTGSTIIPQLMLVSEIFIGLWPTGLASSPISRSYYALAHSGMIDAVWDTWVIIEQRV
ncbi:uncharacterized protein N7469_003482 [Penicillium citrinum]|uniref:Uncharacterized protein n=2 Tax=Penicillium TaxID=5073 RepID=A0A9W9P2U0_PENCI|nr:uncharacterized protein N7469_003482 [Penicillium citrinum]KAJ5234314.1 hypothetical protein N7469_003482 [Penicillium citrinum]KAJ5589924.1 hypothetical protein N7450_003896 [Penicillium hetheringtonii]